MMRINPTPTGGRVVQGSTPWGSYRVEWDARGTLVGERLEMAAPATHEASESNQTGRRTPCTILKAAIRKITGEQPCGACDAHCKEMDKRGWRWCWANRSTIAGWLCESASARANRLEKQAAELAVKAAAARAAADAINPERALTLFMAAWQEMRHRGGDKPAAAIER